MSGVFGWISRKPTEQLNDQISRMAEAMTHRGWYQSDISVYREYNAAYGRIGIGVFNQEPQPIERKEGHLKIWFAGEFYRHNIPDYDPAWNALTDPELALVLYEQRGETAFSQYEGSYQAAIWDQDAGTTYLTVDRYATYPLHYYHDADNFLFSQEYKAILAWPQFKKEINLDALAEYIRMQRVLGSKSFFENIHRLEYACYIKYEHTSGQISLHRYWDFDHIKQQEMGVKEGLEEINRLFEAAIERMTKDEKKPGLYLSGGLDSRMISAKMSHYIRPFHTITYGKPGCADVIIAEKIARKVGSIHHYIPFEDGKWVLDHYDDHLNITEGYHNWPHLHGISTIDYARDFFDIQLNGFIGGFYTSYSRTFKKLKQFNALDDLGYQIKMFDSLCWDSSWPGVSEGEALTIFHPQLKSTMRDRAYRNYLERIKSLRQYSPMIHRNVALAIIENAMTLYHQYVIFYRSGMEVRSPFMDYDLLSFTLSIPADVRVDTSRTIDTLAPELSHIPYAKDLMPPTKNKFRTTLAEINLKGRHAINKIRPGTLNIPAELNTDYEEYLRTDLKDWGESILLDERTLSRGIFNPDFIRSIWRRTQSGEVHTLGKLSPILSYELLLRKFYDE